MSKPKPKKLHAYSVGKLHWLFQRSLHHNEEYLYLPLTGKKKTDVYNKGFLDGRRIPVSLYTDIEAAASVNGVKELLVIEKELLGDKLNKDNQLISTLSLSEAFEVKASAVISFLENYCYHCDLFGEKECFAKLSYDCAEEERERFTESHWHQVRIENRKERKQRKKTCPA
ncbi:hypothetical protein bcgnr5372_37950 [Bacillus luti]|nr:hypothetical protein [Bacillus cereus]HDR8329483.1 hypothetical protein [Bacillus cereus]HDR8337569.1 hypothetical protein [Bacillus cereus]